MNVSRAYAVERFAPLLRGTGALLDKCFHVYRRDLSPSLLLASVSVGAQGLVAVIAFALFDRVAFLLGLFAIALLGNAALAGFALASPIALGALVYWLWPSSPVVQSPGETLRMALFTASLLAAAALGLAALVAEGALTHLYLQRSLGRPAAWKDSLRVSLARRRALWVISAIRLIPAAGEVAFLFGAYSLFVFALSVLRGLWVINLHGAWIVPAALLMGGGLALLAGLLVCALPALMFEQVGALAALRRSAQLGARSAGQLALRFLILWSVRAGVIGIPALLLTLFVPFTWDINSLVGLLGWVCLAALAGMSGVLAFPLTAAFGVMNYLDVRARTEHLDLSLKAEALAASAPASDS